jgi:hypothetical protein
MLFCLDRDDGAWGTVQGHYVKIWFIVLLEARERRRIAQR